MGAGVLCKVGPGSDFVIWSLVSRDLKGVNIDILGKHFGQKEQQDAALGSLCEDQHEGSCGQSVVGSHYGGGN